jgi:hypothetical protein
MKSLLHSFNPLFSLGYHPIIAIGLLMSIFLNNSQQQMSQLQLTHPAICAMIAEHPAQAGLP